MYETESEIDAERDDSFIITATSGRDANGK
jgi:hypothetical protein